MRCERCGNQEQRYFWQDGDVIYCRKCVGFGRIDLGKPIPTCTLKPVIHNCKMRLDYPLTKHQKEASRQVNEALDAGYDVFVYAACGAGKTEIVMKSIERALCLGKQVGFAIARRQVVLEIWERMQKAFPEIHVVPVCEGYTDQTTGDLIVCTMHQLYRYHQGFDLLIMDEVDAFPYRDNEMLETIANHACKGKRIYLSATPDQSVFDAVKRGEIKLVELFQRPHGYPLVIPTLVHAPILFQWFALCRFMKQHHQDQKPYLLFVPTIAQAIRFERICSKFFRCTSFTSKTLDKEFVLKSFKHNEFEFLICTTVLERGITIPGIDVVVWNSDHALFHEASLIQIIGRVGRSFHDPTGEGLFLCTQKTPAIKRCIYALKKMNAYAETS